MSKIASCFQGVVKIGNILIYRGVRIATNSGEFIDGYNDILEAIDGMQSKARGEKIYNFIMGIKECNEELDISEEDFLHIVRKLAKDDESSKTKLYSKLTISLSLNEIMNIDDRVYYIDILGSLTYHEIEYARKCYIYNKFDISGYKNKNEQMVSITKNKDGLTLKSLNSLLTNGLLYDPKEPGSVMSANPAYKASDKLNVFMPLIFDESDLIPQSIDKSKKQEYTAVIAANNVDVNFFAREFAHILNDCNIRSMAINRCDIDRFSVVYYINVINKGDAVTLVGVSKNINFAKNSNDEDGVIYKERVNDFILSVDSKDNKYYNDLKDIVNKIAVFIKNDI